MLNTERVFCMLFYCRISEIKVISVLAVPGDDFDDVRVLTRSAVGIVPCSIRCPHDDASADDWRGIVFSSVLRFVWFESVIVSCARAV